MAEDTMITTIDNPYNPFTDYEKWYADDVAMGYNTCSLLGRLTPADDDSMSDDTVAGLVEYGQDELLRLNPTGMFAKIHKNDKTPLSQEAFNNTHKNRV